MENSCTNSSGGKTKRSKQKKADAGKNASDPSIDLLCQAVENKDGQKSRFRFINICNKREKKAVVFLVFW